MEAWLIAASLIGVIIGGLLSGGFSLLQAEREFKHRKQMRLLEYRHDAARDVGIATSDIHNALRELMGHVIPHFLTTGCWNPDRFVTPDWWKSFAPADALIRFATVQTKDDELQHAVQRFNAAVNGVIYSADLKSAESGMVDLDDLQSEVHRKCEALIARLAE